MKNKKSIFFRIWVINLSLTSILFVVFISSFIYFSAASKENNDEYFDLVFNDILRNVYREFAQINVITDLFIQDSDVVLSAANKLSRKYFVDHALLVSQKLTYVKNSLPSIENVFVYVTNTNEYITSEGISPSDSFLHTQERYLSIDEVLPVFSVCSTGFYSYENFLLYIKKVGDDGCVVVKIDKKNFCNFDHYTSILPGYDILILDQNRELFYSNTSPEYLQQMNYQTFTSKEQLKMQNNTYAMKQIDFLYGDYSLILRKQLSTLDKIYVPIILLGILSTISFIVISFFLVRLNTKQYQPIKRIMKDIEADEFSLPCEPINELEFIQSRMNDLVNEKLNLSRIVNIPKNIQIDMMFNYAFAREPNELPENVLSFFSQRYAQFYIVRIAIQNIDGQIKEEVFFNLNTYLADKHGCLLTNVDSFSWAFILSCEQEWEQVYNSILKYFEEETLQNTKIFIGISDACTQIHFLRNAAEQAGYRLFYCHVSTSDSISFCRSQIDSVQHLEGWNMQTAVMNMILSETKSIEIEEALKQWLFASNIITFQSFLELYNMMVAILKIVISSEVYDISKHELKTSAVIGTYNPTYLYNCLLQDFITVNQSYIRKSNSNSSRYPIVEYISEHYQEQLSLDSISQVFHITPVYLSFWFKKNTGINLSTLSRPHKFIQ